MLTLVGVGKKYLPLRQSYFVVGQLSREYSTKPVQNDKKSDDNIEFRVLELKPKPPKTEKTIRFRRKAIRHRYKEMDTTQNWGNVWTGPRTFHPSSVPLPLRQGYREPQDHNPAPDKFANTELMKIPNFLHLTPPIIKQQCEAIKKFCTPWPTGLETEEKCEKHFPVEYITSDYIQGIPTIRNPLSRIVTIRIKLSNLPLDSHAKDKFLRIVENRYNPETDVVTITADRCPLRVQNYEYTQYLLTASFYEAFKVEPWESLKTEADMEYYDWNRNRSKEVVKEILNYKNSNDGSNKSTDAYSKSVELIFNDGENEQNLQIYKKETLKLLGLKN